MIMMANLAELIRDYLNLSQLASEILASAIIFASAIIIAWLGHSLFEKYFIKWAKRTKTTLDDEILRNIKAPVFLFAIFVGAYYGLKSHFS